MIRLRALAVALAFALAACATPQVQELRERPGDLPRAAEVAEAPFFAQNTNECGPAALAMAFAASGLATTPDALVPEVYTPEREGTLASDIVAASRRHGRLAYPVSDLRTLFREVSAGHPVVVLQNLALSWYPQWHYAVVIGYDLDGGTVTLHSGTTPRLTIGMDTFERTWARGDRWGLVVLEPGKLPATAEPAPYLAAAAGLEQARRLEAARKAYAAGLERWPRNLGLRMGLGNAFYALGQRKASADAFARASKDHPEAADAFNNLAHVRLELGEIAAAEEAARQAVSLGGPNIETYKHTLDAVLARKLNETVGGT